MNRLKIVAVGDGGVGKSCLLITYSTGTFPQDYVPTVFDNYSHSVMVNGVRYNVGLWDTAGQEDYDRLRPLSYTNTDIALLVFSINDRTSFANVTGRWVPELREYMPTVPVLLVGTKSDLRYGDQECIDPSEVFEIAREIGSVGYCEVSALRQSGVDACFKEALEHAISVQQNIPRQPKSPVRRRSRLCSYRCGTTDIAVSQPKPTMPVLPSAGKAPWILPVNATFSRDIGQLLLPVNMMRDPLADLKIEIIEEGTSMFTFMAHKIVLFCACPKLESMVRANIVHDISPTKIDIVGTPENCCTICLDNEANFLVVPCGHQCGCEECLLEVQQATGQCPICREPMKCIQQASSFSESDSGDTLADSPKPNGPNEAVVHDEINFTHSSLRLTGTTPCAVKALLQWLYAGHAEIVPGAHSEWDSPQFELQPSRPKFSQRELTMLNDVENIATAFCSEELQTFVTNIKSGQSWLNPSFGTFMSDTTGARAVSGFLNKPELADVVIKLDNGSSIFAHRTLLVARSEFFRSKLLDPTVTLDSDEAGRFLIPLRDMSEPVCMCILEYLYRDHAAFDSIQSSLIATNAAQLRPVQVMAHARRLGLNRLVSLCELHITRVVDVAVSHSIERSSVDVVALLNVSKINEALQLEKWCLHFISTNFGPMSKRSEWKDLSPEHLKHVTINQWPPLKYYEAVKRYEVEVKKWQTNVKGSNKSISCGKDRNCIIM